MLQIFTTINNTFHASQELQLAYRLFRQSTPDNATIDLLPLQKSINETLSPAIDAYLKQDRQAEYILICTTPWLLWGEHSVNKLLQQLEDHQQLDCLLPNQPAITPLTADTVYYTQRGFNAYVEQLPDQIVPFQQHEAAAFLIRTKALIQHWANVEDVFSIPEQCQTKAAISLAAYLHPAGDYYDHPRHEIFDLIPADCQQILDIGCATGHFGAQLKQERACYVTGIELNPEAAQIAKGRLDQVRVGDALSIELNQRFDLATCLDSLEHFTRPELLLQRIRDHFLTPQGYLIASIPNVGHWSIVADLLAGHWDYVPFGLLCETHYRFYTLHSLTKLLADNGFKIIRIKPEISPIPDQLMRQLQIMQDQGANIDFESLAIVTYHVLAQIDS